MLGFYFALFPSIVSIISSLIVLFYIIANPYSRVTIGLHPFYIALSVSNIFQCVGVFVGDKFCVSFGFYLYLGGILYLSYIVLMIGFVWLKSIKSGDLFITFQPLQTKFIIMHVCLAIQITLGVYFDGRSTSKLYCNDNMDFGEANYNIFSEPLLYIIFYPIILFVMLALLFFLYASCYLDISYSAETLKPLVKRLRYYVRLIEVVVTFALLFLFLQIIHYKINILWKLFVCFLPIAIFLFNLDFFLFMNVLFNDRKRKRNTNSRQNVVALHNALGNLDETESSTLHLLFNKWDSYMGIIPKGTNSVDSGVVGSGAEVLLDQDQSLPPSEYLDIMPSSRSSNPLYIV